MNDRIQRLRRRSLESRPTLSAERAVLVTEFYRDRSEPLLAPPVMRAMAFREILARKTLYLGPDELIVGERGPEPKATPTFPELTCHSLEDLDILNSRPKTPFLVSEETREIYRRTVIPFWKGRSLRDRLFAEMSPEWKGCYEAGIFTEFMEQRAPGHTVLDDKIYSRGFGDFRRDIARRMEEVDPCSDPDALKTREQLRAMDIAAEALVLFAGRYADLALERASRENDPGRKAELLRIAEVCRRVPLRAPRDLWEALQYYWFVHLGVITELNTWDSFNPGRLDQHLFPFYIRGLREGTLTREQARELLEAFWVKFNNQPAPPKVGVTAEESATYTDFCLINIGGLDRTGADGANELSYLLLDVIEDMRLLQPSSAVQVSRRSPDLLLKRAARIIRTGFGQPSLFNTDTIILEMLRQGKSLEDARSGGVSGCVEAGIFGKENYNLTGYFNLPKVLEITLHNGVEPRSGRTLGLETGDPSGFRTFQELFQAFSRQVRHFVDIKIRGNALIEQLYAARMPAPFLSLLIDDCLARGRDYHDGGARYNTSYIQGVGLGTVTDSLASLKHNVFDAGVVSMKETLEALRGNFKGGEILRQRFLNKTPKYGNDDDEADGVMRQVFEAYFQAVDGRPNAKGGTCRINLLPTTVHVYFGRVTGATPDGRRAEEPLSEGISPVQGADRRGPTAVLKSAAKLDHVRTGGTLLNQKLTPHLLDSEEGLDNLVHLVRTYFELGGHHIQFNVVTAETLRRAQEKPELFRDLIVRVAGYSDYFVDISPTLQDEIIRRTEHDSF
ncbi:MAG: glycyl radical enzyme [Candidatus Aminicenantes bacterium RBG_13_63_10]|nr:MAG: glycyl radical enzyme [Candidatus Aminicenantes bacterium RBG_13_63_10]